MPRSATMWETQCKTDLSYDDGMTDAAHFSDAT